MHRRNVIFEERIVRRKRLKWFFGGRRCWRHIRTALIFLAHRTFHTDDSAHGAIFLLLIRMTSFRVSHQIRLQFECLGANVTAKWTILRMGDNVIAIQMAIGEFFVAYFACVHLLLGVFVIDVIFEGVHCGVRCIALAAHEIRSLILVQMHVPQ